MRMALLAPRGLVAPLVPNSSRVCSSTTRKHLLAADGGGPQCLCLHVKHTSIVKQVSKLPLSGGAGCAESAADLQVCGGQPRCFDISPSSNRCTTNMALNVPWQSLPVLDSAAACFRWFQVAGTAAGKGAAHHAQLLGLLSCHRVDAVTTFPAFSANKYN